MARTPAAWLVRDCEDCWILVGRRRDNFWTGRRVRPTAGDRASVNFDAAWVLEREERRGDVIGFMHTHPDGPSEPSARDLRTMRAWVSAFGKPLLCVIISPAGPCGYRFDSFDAPPIPVTRIFLFTRGVILGAK